MPYGQYDLQISISDNSLSNGDVLFNDDVDVAGVIAQIERFAPMPPVLKLIPKRNDLWITF